MPMCETEVRDVRSCFMLFLCVLHVKIVSDLNVKSVIRRTKINCIASVSTRMPGTMKQSDTEERGQRKEEGTRSAWSTIGE